MKLYELSKKEMMNINGGDEPAYGIGYAIGKLLHDVDIALGEFFFGEDSIWSLGRYWA